VKDSVRTETWVECGWCHSKPLRQKARIWTDGLGDSVVLCPDCQIVLMEYVGSIVDDIETLCFMVM